MDNELDINNLFSIYMVRYAFHSDTNEERHPDKIMLQCVTLFTDSRIQSTRDSFAIMM